MRYLFITLSVVLLSLQVLQANEAGLTVVFSDDEIRVIRSYYHDHYRNCRRSAPTLRQNMKIRQIDYKYNNN